MYKYDPTHTEVAKFITDQLWAKKQYNETLPYFETVIKQNPDNIILRFRYANVLIINHHNKQAVEEYKKLLERQPDDSIILYNMAVALKISGQLGNAMSCYNRAIKQDPNHDTSLFNPNLNHIISDDFEIISIQI